MSFAYLAGAGVGLAVIPAVVYLVCAVLINAGREAVKLDKLFNPIKVAGITFVVFFFIGFVVGPIPKEGRVLVGGINIIPFLLSLIYYVWCQIKRR